MKKLDIGNNATQLIFLFGVFMLIVLCAGDPDLLDAIIERLKR